jgi:hypothetical protein
MYVGGDFTEYDGYSSPKLIKLTTDGLIDASFSVGSGFNSSVYYIQILNSLNILVTGNFTSYNSLPNSRIVELTYTGSVSLITYGSGFNSAVRKVALKTDYLLGGDFTTYQSSNVSYITKLSSNGSISTNYPFPPVRFNSSVFDIYVENSSNYLVGGNFTTYNSCNVNYLTRLVENPYVWINTGNNLFINPSITPFFTSTVTGLATIGYISTSQLTSTVTGIGSIGGGVSQSALNSTIEGLGSIGYISTTQLTSSIEGIISMSSKYIIQSFSF